jgi:hypothetical protein
LAFEEDTKNENDQLEGVDWLTLVPHKKIVCLEDAVCKSSRLKDEGSLLAQSERFMKRLTTNFYCIYCEFTRAFGTCRN